MFIDFNAYRRKSAKPLYMFMENKWLLDPAVEVCKNIAACGNKASQMKECVLFAILLYARIHENTWALLVTVSHKYATDTMNNYNIDEEHPPPWKVLLYYLLSLLVSMYCYWILEYPWGIEFGGTWTWWDINMVGDSIFGSISYLLQGLYEIL